MIQTVLESGVVTVEKELWTTPLAIEGDSGSMECVGMKYNKTTGELEKNGIPTGWVDNSRGCNVYKFVYHNKKSCRAHRLIWELEVGKIPEGMVIDHIDGNGLNNKLDNLRLVTMRQNAMNRKVRSLTGYKGVWFSKNPKGKPYRVPWVVTIEKEGTKYTTRGFVTAKEAAKFYNDRAKELFGECAWLNPV